MKVFFKITFFFGKNGQTEPHPDERYCKSIKLRVSTISGEAVLRGHVSSLQDVYHAAEVVNRVEGVKALLNGLSEK